MAVDKNFVAELLHQMASLGAISSRPMFGGLGIFVDGEMFAKISPSNIIAFKADERSRVKFLELGMKKSGKMLYYEATADQLEDPEALLAVARCAREAALR